VRDDQPAVAPPDIKPPPTWVIPAGSKPRQCSKCRAIVYDVPSPKGTGSTMPLRAVARCYYRAKNVILETPECAEPSAPGDPTGPRDGRGFSHFVDCPFAHLFRTRGKK
jgi:hypothetical protein